MENYNPKENEDRNEGCVDELGGPSLPKRPKSIEFSNAYNQDLDARKNKKNFPDDIDLGVNPTQERFGSPLNLDQSHRIKLGNGIPSDNENLSHADHAIKSISTKKENLPKINFSYIEGKLLLKSIIDELKIEIKKLEESFNKDFVDKDVGEENVPPLTSSEEGATIDFPSGHVSLNSEEDIQLISNTFYPEKDKERITSSTAYSSNFYDMEKFPRGKLIIINVKYFKKSSGLSEWPREGTDRDALGLQQLFLDLGFIVARYDNPSTSEIKNVMHASANEDYSKLGCER